MSNVQKVIKHKELEQAMMSCISCDYEIIITYKDPYLHETDLKAYLKKRKEMACHYFETDKEDQKQYLREMFIEINEKIARFLNIPLEQND